MRELRQTAIIGAAGAVVCFAVWGQQLLIRSADDEIRVSAPQLHFLTGKPLDRLHDAIAVPYDFQLSILTDPRTTVIRRGLERFVISYDIWEERFSATRVRGQRLQATHLTASATEAWCLDHISVPLSGISAEQPIWLKLEVRAQEPHDRLSNPNDEGMSIAALIEMFSRAGRTRPPDYWHAEAGPIRLADLRHIGLRGAD